MAPRNTRPESSQGCAPATRALRRGSLLRRWLGGALSCLLLGGSATAKPLARVVAVHDPAALVEFEPRPEAVARLVERGLLALAGEERVADSWRQFVSSNDVVGIKVVARGGPLFAVRKEVVRAIATGLQAAGVPAPRIVIWDKYGDDLLAAGYRADFFPPGVRVEAVVPGSGFDPDVRYRSPLAGKLIWGDLLFGGEEEVSAVSHLARLVSREVTKVINVATLCHHSELGLAGALYNLAIGSVDNVRRFQNDAGACAAAVPEILSLPPLREKTVLHIVDGLLGQYDVGPNFHPASTWHHGTLYLSRDPVALDSVALEQIESQRRSRALRPVAPRAAYLAAAAAAGLGVRDSERIEIVRPVVP